MNGLTDVFFTCKRCGGVLELPRVCENGTVKCYHCGLPTWLPQGAQSPILKAKSASETFDPPATPVASTGAPVGDRPVKRIDVSTRAAVLALVWMGLAGTLLGFGLGSLLKPEGPPLFRFRTSSPVADILANR